MKDILSKFVIERLVCIVFWCIAIWGSIKKTIILRKLKKRDDKEIFNQEISDELKAATLLIVIGFLGPFVVSFIVALIIYFE